MEGILSFIKQLYLRIQENETTARGAQLSYFFILSIFPFLIFLITLIDYTPLSQQHTLDQLALLLPDNAFAIVEQIVSEVEAADNFTLLSLGILGTIWTASRGTAALIKSLNKAYDITESRSFFVLNTIGIAATLALALLILFTLSFLVFGRVLGELAFQYLGLEGLFQALWPVLRFSIPLLIIFSSFTLLFLYSPNCRLRLRHVYPGAIFSTLSWIIASQAFAYYVNNFGNFSRTYGSIGGIIVFMIWLYLSSVVVLLGGEINATLYNSFCKSNEKSWTAS
ncbi:YihY/virulence factor BrkB family protein [Dethiobacter alkaliphilus]|uniref:YihY/virulence factor BrkB family protein n=1 Tax=Dethiobacter alkaliphilus TaxID=427926 RepID=UPI002227F541|nr:YihY/virulence factor BrkB family protein [Dethiobacter alkaliphilus]MCW3490985.1 YihY/virulence factor BrkB family protein [Dethiobacter alkaliphilus]